MSQLEHLRQEENTSSHINSSRNHHKVKQYVLQFSSAVLVCLSGCASEPTPRAPARVSRPSDESILISLTLLEENMLLQESELRRIRMDMARLSDEDLANPIITDAFQQRKLQVENALRIYYDQCKFRSVSMDHLPPSISPEDERQFLQPDEDDAGRFNTQLSDSIFLLEMRQRDLRLAIHGQVPPECADQEAVLEFRQAASERLEESERMLQKLYRVLLQSSFH